MKDSELGRVPNSWGLSDLTLFLDHIRSNQLTSFVHLRTKISAIEKIDEAFKRRAENASNLRGQFLAPAMILRAHSAFRGAFALALAGFGVETFALIRCVLENVGYALLMARDSELESLWISRHSNPDGIKKIARTFTSQTIRKEIEKSDPEEATRFEQFYQRSIDFGAHPNAHGFNASVVTKETDSELVMNMIYLHADDETHLHTLKNLGQAGLCALAIISLTFPERFSRNEFENDLAAACAIWPF